MGSVLLPSKLPNVRRYSYNYNPPLSPATRRNPRPPPLKSYSTTPAAGMSSRYYRPPSPRRYGHPARSSTGTFDPYYDHHLYSNHSSPRSSAERIAAVQHPGPYAYAPGTESGSKSSKSKYDTYTGRPRRSTLTESDGMVRPPPGSLQPTKSIPIRTHYDRPSSPLAHSWDSRAEPYLTHAPSKRDHKRIYSVDDNRSAKLIAEIEPHRPETKSSRGSSSRSGPRYHYAKPAIQPADLRDEDYSYTDPASMYRETEPVWRRPRSGSVERGSRPTSLIMEKAPRSSNRELGPPPSMRGFDKINSGIARNGSLRDPSRTSSWDRSGDVSKYPDEYYSNPPRSGSSRHPSTTVHQDHHDRRRDTYHDDHRDGRGREVDTKRRGTSDRYEDREADPKRHGASDRYEDREVASRGFGIRTGETRPGRDEILDSQPIWSPHETGRSRTDDYGGGFYPPDDPQRAPGTRMPEPRVPRERESPRYDERPREKDSHHRDRAADDRGYAAAAVPAAGAAVAFGATEVMKHRDRDRDSEKDRDSPREDRVERYEESPRHEDEGRRRRHRRAPSSDESNDDRPRHYIDRDAARDGDSRRKESTRKAEPALDPDEEYRRRIQEQERSLRSARDRDHSDSDRESDRRHRKDDRDRDVDDSDADRRQRASPTAPATEPAHPRYDDRSNSVLDKDMVQEPELLTHTDSRNMQIVAPPKDPAPQPKGILRKPTEKFPEEPEPIREGVAPHKSALKGKDIPVNARWTKIDRRLVNPEALEEAKERFEERMDCVIVLRVLTKQDIQKLADRTREIREAREEEYERERSRRRRRSRKDEEDRDEDYDSEDDEYEKERERERPRMIESGR